MNPFRWSYRTTCFVGLLICLALLGFALYAEHVLHMEPCPLCIFQRIGFMVMAVFFLLGAIFPRKRGARWVFTSGAIVGGLAGLAVAGRHLWLQTLPPDEIPSCGPNLGYMMNTFPFHKVLQMVFTGSGECAKVEPILGLPMPAWTTFWYLVLIVLILVATLRKPRTP